MGRWFEEAVFYHMYPIGMTGAPRRNEQGEVSHRFEQLMKWLPHIEALGCTAIYIGPLFESTSHGYDTRDYKLVDRRLGDNGDFKEFVEDAHARGIKVVVDGVFNHTGREFFAFQDIQKNRENSPYCNWYKGVNFGWNSPYNDGFGYEAWRNCFELVNLNLWEPKVREYLLEVVGFWIDEFDIDGIRLDCADCLEFSFMEELRRFTNEKKADFWLMGEVIHGDYSRYIGPHMLDSVTNYELHKGLYSGHNDHNYFEIAHTIRREFDQNGGIYRGLKLYSFVDNHDVDRIASKLQVPGHIYPVHTLLFTLPGIPSIYYGSEWGIQGRKEGANDDPLRPAVDLDEVLKDVPDPELLEWVQTLGRIHKEQPALSDGTYQELLLTNRQFAFARVLGDEGVIVAVNNHDKEAELNIRVPLPDKKCESLLDGETIEVQDGMLHIRLLPNQSQIISMV
ncbi:alpha-amylase family glycosyl hydrolase [Blautia schinkii]|nr:alpha-amylase family glycosyl hydrolase [Blautia schinkii]